MWKFIATRTSTASSLHCTVLQGFFGSKMDVLTLLSFIHCNRVEHTGRGGPSCPWLLTIPPSSQHGCVQTHTTTETSMASHWCYQLSVQVSNRVEVRSTRGGGFCTGSHAEAPSSRAASRNTGYYASVWLFQLGLGKPLFASTGKYRFGFF